MSRIERIKEKLKVIGPRHHRKLGRFSDGFNDNFKFFFLLSKSGLIHFCGEKIDVEFDVNGPSSKMCFRQFEDGMYRGKNIITRHPNITYHVLMGKKGWGLWSKEWSQGISEGSFRKKDILEEFSIRGIKIPDCFMKEFDNNILKYTLFRMDSSSGMDIEN